jgi:hypothetical protein
MNQIGDFSGRVRAAAEWSGFLPRAPFFLNPQDSGAPSRPNIPDVAHHAAFRLIEQAPTSKAGLFSKLQRRGVRWRDSKNDLPGFCCRSQIFMWAGLALAAVFLAAAVRLRRYRGPI